MRLNRLSAASLTLAMSLSAAAGASVSNDTLQADARATTVDHRDETVVAYTALEKDGWIFVKVEHRPTWHTYAMDNLLRAQERSGNEEPEAELPTVIHLDGAASSEGWLQSEPKDLSQPELRWYTWGFEDTSWFARRAEGDVEQLVIDAQACTADRCAMVEELAVPVLPAESGDLPDIEGLEPVRSAAGESAAEESAALPVLEGEALLDKEGKRFNDDDIFDVVTYRQLDGDCDGKVSMAELVKVTRSSSEYPRSLNWLVNFDPDEDGFVASGELAEGLRKNRARQIQRLMDVDADGNGRVTMQEHALSYAFREGREKVEEQGQKKWFNDLDLDDDGLVVEQEVTDYYRILDTARFWGYVLVHRVGMADADANGWITRKELGAALAEAEGRKRKKLTDEAEAWFDRFDGEAPDESQAVPVNALFGRLQYRQDKDIDWMLELEAPVRSLLTPACAR